MKLLLNFIVASSLLIISGCTTTPNKTAGYSKNEPILSPNQLIAFEHTLSVNEKKLWQHSQRYSKDTYALAKLANIHYKAVEHKENLANIQKAIISYQLLFQRKPADYLVAYRYYRLNLYLGFYEKSFNVAYWTSFFKQHPFLRGFDIAPPAYVAYLSSQPEKLDNSKKLAYLNIAYRQNPSFINGKVELAKLYQETYQYELGLFLFQQAQSSSPDNPVILFNQNQLRFQYVYSQCHLNSQHLTVKAIEDAKKLIKLVPENPTGHYQLSLALRYIGQHTLAKFSAQKAAKMSVDYQYNLYLAQLWNGNNDKVISAILQEKNKQLTVDEKRLLIVANIQQKNWQQVANLVDNYINDNDMDFYISIYGIYAHQYLQQPLKRNLLIQKLKQHPNLSANKKLVLAYINKEITKKELEDKAVIHCYDNKIATLDALELLVDGKTDEFYQTLEYIKSLQVYSSEEYAIAKQWLKNKVNSKN